jgi:hypothetical protein
VKNTINKIKGIYFMRYREFAPTLKLNEYVDRREQFANAIEPRHTEYDDKNRPRLTLGRLQKLRKKRDVDAVERKEHAELVRTMYSWENNLPPELRAKLEMTRLQGNEGTE